MTAAPPHLDEWLCLALYNASRAMTGRYRDLLADLELTYPQYLVMTVLWEDGECTVGRLGQRLRLDSGTLSPMLSRLERNGLVTRSRSPRDDRATVVAPTESGIQLREHAAGVPDEVCHATGLTADEMRLLVTQLRSLVDRLDG